MEIVLAADLVPVDFAPVGLVLLVLVPADFDAEIPGRFARSVLVEIAVPALVPAALADFLPAEIENRSHPDFPSQWNGSFHQYQPPRMKPVFPNPAYPSFLTAPAAFLPNHHPPSIRRRPSIRRQPMPVYPQWLLHSLTPYHKCHTSTKAFVLLPACLPIFPFGWCAAANRPIFATSIPGFHLSVPPILPLHPSTGENLGPILVSFLRVLLCCLGCCLPMSRRFVLVIPESRLCWK